MLCWNYSLQSVSQLNKWPICHFSYVMRHFFSCIKTVDFSWLFWSWEDRNCLSGYLVDTLATFSTCENERKWTAEFLEKQQVSSFSIVKRGAVQANLRNWVFLLLGKTVRERSQHVSVTWDCSCTGALFMNLLAWIHTSKY